MGKLIVVGGGETPKKGKSFNSSLLEEIFKSENIENALLIIPPADKQEEVQKTYEKLFKKIIKPKPEFIFLEEKKQSQLKNTLSA